MTRLLLLLCTVYKIVQARRPKYVRTPSNPGIDTRRLTLLFEKHEQIGICRNRKHACMVDFLSRKIQVASLTAVRSVNRVNQRITKRATSRMQSRSSTMVFAFVIDTGIGAPRLYYCWQSPMEEPVGTIISSIQIGDSKMGLL